MFQSYPQGYQPQGYQQLPQQGVPYQPQQAHQFPPQQAQQFQSPGPQMAPQSAPVGWAANIQAEVARGSIPYLSTIQLCGQVAPSQYMPQGFKVNQGQGPGGGSLRLNLKLREVRGNRVNVYFVEAVAFGPSIYHISQQLQVGTVVAVRGSYVVSYRQNPNGSTSKYPQIRIGDPDGLVIVGQLAYVNEQPTIFSSRGASGYGGQQTSMPGAGYQQQGPPPNQFAQQPQQPQQGYYQQPQQPQQQFQAQNPQQGYPAPQQAQQFPPQQSQQFQPVAGQGQQQFPPQGQFPQQGQQFQPGVGALPNQMPPGYPAPGQPAPGPGATPQQAGHPMGGQGTGTEDIPF